MCVKMSEKGKVRRRGYWGLGIEWGYRVSTCLIRCKWSAVCARWLRMWLAGRWWRHSCPAVCVVPDNFLHGHLLSTSDRPMCEQFKPLSSPGDPVQDEHCTLPFGDEELHEGND